ncbi:tyrosine-type recombinase/integrase [Frigoriglobus tundricola]|uniref:Tyr recombinase domain-containing protein n=1 Tax=Frigoriglobus tundricola TaxID=2774151 RepID=A0A6M5YJP2_9BACT|nr:tyrosine-type recombinase/integrase [Frigoriglobus tundricola]QJW94198.1 hypothetical protein FTUN_1717 [Frigoriglobus tundricola]
MASLQERNGSYRVQFFFRGKLHGFTLGKVSVSEADAKAAQVDYLLMRLKQKLITLPDGTDIVSFVQHDGKPPATPSVTVPGAPRQAVSLSHLRDQYLTTHGNGTLEANTLATCRLHFSHLCRVLGGGLTLTELTLHVLQSYVTTRAGSEIATATIRKELSTFRAAWNWGGAMGLITGTFPSRGLRYPKTDDKSPFMTLAEVTRQLGAASDPSTLWESLYLTAPEVAELLAHVKERAAHPWIYPLVCFAAHTGARRSEILRVLTADIDFDKNVVTIREKKRSRGRRTSRRIPLTPFLRDVLTDWLKSHPGGPALFCQTGTVARSKKRSRTTGHLDEKKRPSGLKGRLATVKQRESVAPSALTKDEVHDHFSRTLRESKWENVRGLHTLRHSFVSACASKGVDQRVLQEWCGHMSPDMSRRYAHLYPSTQQEAIKSVFG